MPVTHPPVVGLSMLDTHFEEDISFISMDQVNRTYNNDIYKNLRYVCHKCYCCACVIFCTLYIGIESLILK